VPALSYEAGHRSLHSSESSGGSALAFLKLTHALAITTSDQDLDASAALHACSCTTFRTKPYNQIVLKGALHLTDYVTKVMKRLSDQSVDPKVMLEFVFSLYYS